MATTRSAEEGERRGELPGEDLPRAQQRDLHRHERLALALAGDRPRGEARDEEEHEQEHEEDEPLEDRPPDRREPRSATAPRTGRRRAPTSRPCTRGSRSRRARGGRGSAAASCARAQPDPQLAREHGVHRPRPLRRAGHRGCRRLCRIARPWLAHCTTPLVMARNSSSRSPPSWRNSTTGKPLGEQVAQQPRLLGLVGDV